jgi:hypothetical protein
MSDSYIQVNNDISGSRLVIEGLILLDLVLVTYTIDLSQI